MTDEIKDDAKPVETAYATQIDVPVKTPLFIVGYRWNRLCDYHHFRCVWFDSHVLTCYHCKQSKKD